MVAINRCQTDWLCAQSRQEHESKHNLGAAPFLCPLMSSVRLESSHLMLLMHLHGGATMRLYVAIVSTGGPMCMAHACMHGGIWWYMRAGGGMCCTCMPEQLLVAIVGFSVKETHVLLTCWVFQTFLMLQSNPDDQLSGQL